MKLLIILSKELKINFKSPTIYLLTAGYSLISGWIFFNLLVSYVENTQHLVQSSQAQIAFLDSVVLKLFGNLNFLFLFTLPLLVMKSFSDEIKNQTIYHYKLAGISELELIVAKFTAQMINILFMLAPTLIFIYVLSFANLKEYALVFTGFFGLFLTSLSYISMGLFFSSLTSNVIMSASYTLFSILSLWLLSWGSQISTNYLISQNLKYMSIVSHFENMARGTIHLQDIIYFFTFILFFLFLTNKSIKTRFL
jgi:ABC-2 type transport system permease protein